MTQRIKHIYQRKDGRWETRMQCGYDEYGKRKYRSVYTKTFEEAHRALLDFKSGIYPDAPAVSEICTKWLIAARPRVKQSTYACYEARIRNHIIPYLGQLPADKINHAQIVKFASILNDHILPGTRNPLAKKTVGDILTLLKSICSFGVENKWIKENPCDRLPVRISRNTAPIQVLTPHECIQLENELKKKVDLKKAGILLGLYTGMRIGEICALRVGSFNLENAVVHVNTTMQRICSFADTHSGQPKTTVIIDTPKSEQSIRDIPLPETIHSVLKTLLASLPPDAFFLSGQAGKRIEPRNFSNYFKRCLHDCGVKPVHFHTLRHTFATRCVESGVDVKTLSEVLGHSSISITLSKYVHPSLEMKRAELKKLSFCANPS